MPHTDYRNLPDDVKRELVFDAFKITKACVALSNLTSRAPELWGQQISDAAYQDMRTMTQAQINEAIAKIEAARKGYGARMERVYIDPPPNDDHNPFPHVNQDDPNKPGPGDQF